MKKLYIYSLLLFCALLSGCVLEDIEERGDICPPGRLLNSGDGRHVVFTNLDCYEDYVLLSEDLSDFASSCSQCELIKDDPEQWKCSGSLTPCLDKVADNFKQNYAHCEHYRAHGILEAGSHATLGIMFVRDYFGTDVPEDEFKSYDLSHSCPINYEVCKYDGKYINELDEDGIAGGYGCFQSCTGNLLYCGEGKQRHCVNPENDSDYCGAQGDCSDPNRGSSNWRGVMCDNGMVCQGGECICGEGYKACANAGGACVDIMHSSEHCGESCEVCDSDMVCIDGTCVKYDCDEKGLCQKSDCKNSDVACGESCMDCSAIANVSEAVCEDGRCTILKCIENYHIYKDDNVYECRRNSIESCAPPVKPLDSDYAEILDCREIEHSKEVACGTDGQCVVKECKAGFEVSDSQTECTVHDCIGCNPVSEICYNGTCRCKEGWVSCSEKGGNCKDIINDLSNCGECGKICNLSNVAHVETYGCEYALCVVTKCTSGFHPYEQTCEMDNENNCGAHERNCLNDIPNVESATCDYINSKCIINKCKKNYHIHDEECELDTKEHCNGFDHSCLIEGSADVACEWDETKGHSVCITKECEDGYHLANDSNSIDGALKCEKDDELNCGATNNKCLESEACVKVGGAYICQCKNSLTKCGNACVDTTNDANHCGGCGQPCLGGKVCTGGSCQCPSDKPNWCGNSCVAYGTNENCGSCGDACINGKQCNGSSCQCPSDKPNWCNNSCVAYGTNENCGGCGDACTHGKQCNGSSCQCPTNTPNWCNGSCVSYGTNENCGDCGDVCTGGRFCSHGACVCSNGTDWCNGQCVNYQNDVNNCGSCGHSCNGHPCNNGSCSCSYTKDGKVVNVNNNVNIRTGPSTDYPTDGAYDKGATVNISCRDGSWYRMTSCNYVHTDYVLANNTTGLVDHTEVKVRKGPNSSTILYIGVFDGKQVDIQDKETGSDGYVWYKVHGYSTVGWLTGYIRSDLISISDGVPGC